MRKLLSLALVLASTSAVFAGGYRVSIQGQKQLAMGHTGVAVVNSAEVGFFNPAGISFLEKKFNLSVGASAIFSSTAFQNSTYNWAAQSNNVGTPFSVHATYKITDWLTAGLSVYTPYGSTVEYEQDWAGSHLINNIALQAIFVQPTIAVRVGEHFSVGGGPIFVQGSVNFNRNISRSLTDENGNRTDLTVDGKGITAMGYTAGFMFNPSDKVRLGMNYRSEIMMEARGGDATFADVPAYLASTLTNTKFDADLPLPAELTVGLSVKASEKLLLAFDYNYALWSSYKSLDVDFANSVPTSINPRNYKNSGAYRFGAQYNASEKLDLRAGWYLDESPVQDGYFAPETPRNDGMGFTGGLTYNVSSRLGVDFSLLYITFKEIDNSYDHASDGSSFFGTYKSSALAPGLGITYGF